MERRPASVGTWLGLLFLLAWTVPLMARPVERRVELREGPTLDAPRLGVLAEKMDVEVLERDGEWIHVRLPRGTEGWAHRVGLTPRPPRAGRPDEARILIEHDQPLYLDRDLGKPPIRMLVAGEMPLRRAFEHTWREVTTEAGEHGWIHQRIFNMNGLPVLVERALHLEGWTATAGYERVHEALFDPLERLWRCREAGGLAQAIAWGLWFLGVVLLAWLARWAGFAVGLIRWLPNGAVRRLAPWAGLAALLMLAAFFFTLPPFVHALLPTGVLLGFLALSSLATAGQAAARGRCPKCRRMFVVECVGGADFSQQHGTLTVTTDSASGRNQETRAFTETHGELDYRCKRCGYRWSRGTSSMKLG